MAFAKEQREAASLLRVVEDGTPPIGTARPSFEDADPVLVYFLFAWLRVHYPTGHPASDGVLGRIGELCSASAKVAEMVRESEKDSLVLWFEDTYDYRDLERDAFIELIIEKLEG